MVLLKIHTSQGSVAAQLRCGDIINNWLIANCLQNVPVKKFENRSIFGEDMDNDKVGSFFPETQCSQVTPTLHCCDVTVESTSLTGAATPLNYLEAFDSVLKSRTGK